VAKALRALQGRDLWLAGLTSGRFMALFSVAAVALSQVIDYIPQTLIDQALARITGVPLLLGLGIVLALFFATWALSTVVFALQFANFTVRRFEDRLELDWGSSSGAMSLSGCTACRPWWSSRDCCGSP